MCKLKYIYENSEPALFARSRGTEISSVAFRKRYSRFEFCLKNSAIICRF